MRKFFAASLLGLGLAFHASVAQQSSYEPREGDVIFQSFPHSELTDTIEGATGSAYSHCGLVAKKGNNWVVIEAIGPVQETPMREWIARGREGNHLVFRPREQYAPKIREIIANARAFSGRPYDIHFSFDDEKIYCSELVYKAFEKATGEKLGVAQKLGDLNWRPHTAFIKKIENGNVPLEREMITPVAVTKAGQLEKVFATDGY